MGVVRGLAEDVELGKSCSFLGWLVGWWKKNSPVWDLEYFMTLSSMILAFLPVHLKSWGYAYVTYTLKNI